MKILFINISNINIIVFFIVESINNYCFVNIYTNIQNFTSKITRNYHHIITNMLIFNNIKLLYYFFFTLILPALYFIITCIFLLIDTGVSKFAYENFTFFVVNLN